VVGFVLLLVRDCGKKREMFVVELGRSGVRGGDVYVHANDRISRRQDLNTHNVQRAETPDTGRDPAAVCQQSSDWSATQGTTAVVDQSACMLKLTDCCKRMSFAYNISYH